VDPAAAVSDAVAPIEFGHSSSAKCIDALVETVGRWVAEPQGALELNGGEEIIRRMERERMQGLEGAAPD
jgi:hypothetical protein